MTRSELAKFSTTLNEITMSLSERMFRPPSKGEIAEMEALDALETGSEDLINRLGGGGEPDIVAKPWYKGAQIGQTVILEVKDTSRWSRQYVAQLEKSIDRSIWTNAILLSAFWQQETCQIDRGSKCVFQFAQFLHCPSPEI